MQAGLKTTDVVYDVLALWDPHPVPVRHLVAVARLFSFTENATRVGIRRLVLRERVQSAKAGDSAGYRLTERHREINVHVRQACARRPRRPWDGGWLQVLLSVPDDRRKARSKIQDALKVWHFASPYRGVWMRPANIDVTEYELLETLRERLEEGHLDVMRCELVDPDRERAMADALWQAPTKAAVYRDAVSQLDAMASDAAALPLEEALVDTWLLGRDAVRLVYFDPQLPRELLPPEWPGDALRRSYARFRRAGMRLWIEFARATEGFLGLDEAEFERISRSMLKEQRS